MHTDARTQDSIKVWDFLLRFFHWSLALLFVVSYLTGDDESQLHVWSGYAIAGLLLFRLVWGFVGPEYARFSNFIYSRREMLAYARGLLRGDAPRYLGHNPLGGLMIVVLLLSLTVTASTGMLYYGADEGKGPLAGVMAAQQDQTVSPIAIARADDDDHHGRDHDDDERFEYLEELHEWFANFTLFLVLIHLAGVLVESLFHHENLVRAMWTGRKKIEPGA